MPFGQFENITFYINLLCLLFLATFVNILECYTFLHLVTLQSLPIWVFERVGVALLVGGCSTLRRENFYVNPIFESRSNPSKLLRWRNTLCDEKWDENDVQSIFDQRKNLVRWHLNDWHFIKWHFFKWHFSTWHFVQMLFLLDMFEPNSCLLNQFESFK